MPLLPAPDDPHPARPRDRALLILLVLAHEAELAPDQVVSSAARAIAARGITAGGVRPWMCHRRWAG